MEAPAIGEHEPLNEDTFRAAFLWSWAMATSEKAPAAVLKTFKLFASSFRYRYVFLPDDDAAEARKWEENRKVGERAATVVLKGYKLIFGVGEVKNMLRASAQDHSADAVYNWYESRGLQIFQKKTIGQMCRWARQLTSLHHSPGLPVKSPLKGIPSNELCWRKARKTRGVDKL